MKPAEILSIIEEACGTSIYQTKRQQAHDLIKKKEMKIQETNRLLEEDIKPQFEKLEQDKKTFDYYNEVDAKIKERQRLETAYEYSELVKVVEDKSGTKTALTKEIDDFKLRIANAKQ